MSAQLQPSCLWHLLCVVERYAVRHSVSPTYQAQLLKTRCCWAPQVSLSCSLSIRVSCYRMSRRLSRTWREMDVFRRSLRFKNPDVEAGFVQTASKRLARNCFIVGCACCSMYIAGCVWNALVSHYDRKCFNWRLCVGRDICFSMVTFCMTFGIGAQLRWRWLSPMALEIYCVACVCIVLMFGILIEKWYFATVFGGGHPDSTLKPDNGWVMMMINLSVVVSHMTVPIRCCMLLPIQVLSVVVFPVIAGVYDSDFPVATVLGVWLLVGLSMDGRRTWELRERELYMRLVQEKTLRAQSEFELSQREGGEPSKRATSLTDDGPSLGMGYLFDNSVTDSKVEAHMANVQAVGISEHWILDADDIRVAPKRVLGSGGFGLVVEGTYCGALVAIKMSRPQLSCGTAARLQDTLTELRVLRRVRHMNILGFYGAVLDVQRSEVSLVVERVAGPVLNVFIESMLKDDIKLEDWVPQRAFLFSGVVRALAYLHHRRPAIVHGDVKPGNILLEHVMRPGKMPGFYFRPKVADFGLSRVLSGTERPMGGSIRWMAPEVVSESPPMPSVAADVFSFGRLAPYIISHTKPFEGLDRPGIVDALRRGSVEAPPAPEGLPEFDTGCWAVSAACLVLDPGARPTMAVVSARLDAIAGEYDFDAVDTLPPQELRTLSIGADLLRRREGPPQGKAGPAKPPVINEEHMAFADGEGSEASLEGEERSQIQVAEDCKKPALAL